MGEVGLWGKILRGDGGSDVAWWESRGAVLDRRDGEKKGKEEDKIKFAKALKSFRENN